MGQSSHFKIICSFSNGRTSVGKEKNILRSYYCPLIHHTFASGSGLRACLHLHSDGMSSPDIMRSKRNILGTAWQPATMEVRPEMMPSPTSIAKPCATPSFVWINQHNPEPELYVKGIEPFNILCFVPFGRLKFSEQRVYSYSTGSNDMNLSKFQEVVKDREAWCAAIHGAAEGQTRLSDWTTITPPLSLPILLPAITSTLFINLDYN